MPINKCSTCTNNPHGQVFWETKHLISCPESPNPQYGEPTVIWFELIQPMLRYFVCLQSEHKVPFSTRRCEAWALRCSIVHRNGIITLNMFSSSRVGGNMTSGTCCQVTQPLSIRVMVRNNGGCMLQCLGCALLNCTTKEVPGVLWFTYWSHFL